MALEEGKIYTPASAEEIAQDWLTDFRLEARKYADEDAVDRACLPGSDAHILSVTEGNLGILQYSNFAQAQRDGDERFAKDEALDAIREALGLPDVPPSPSTGRVVALYKGGNALKNVTFNNDEFTLPNGKRGRVAGVHSGTFDVLGQFEVPVVTIDTGSDTVAKAGTIIKWVSPPTNTALEGKVSVNLPLSGGADVETDERKRDRIVNRRKNVPGGGNWAQAVEIALNSLGTVQAAFAYPALGGPSSAKIVICRDIDESVFFFSRAMSSTATAFVRAAIHAAYPGETEIVVQSVVDQPVDVTLAVTLPASVLNGGNGLGWLDKDPWPPLPGGQVRVAITAVNGNQITVDAVTVTSAVAGQTHIVWWSKVDQAFHQRLVTAVTGSSGAWVLTLNAPLVDHNNAAAAVGEFISPAAANMLSYGKTWRNVMRGLGPGENTTDVNRLPRALRHPFVTDAWYSNLTSQQLTAVSAKHKEIINAAWSYQSATAPTVPGAVTTAPNILVPGHFGIYAS